MKLSFAQLVTLAEAASTPRPNVAPYNAGRRDIINNDAYNRITPHAQRYRDAGWMKKIGMRLGLDREARNAYKAQQNINKADINSLNAQSEMSDKEITHDKTEHNYNMERRDADIKNRRADDIVSDTRRAQDRTYNLTRGAIADKQRRQTDQISDIEHERNTAQQLGDSLKNGGWSSTANGLLYTMNSTNNAPEWVFDANTRQPRAPSAAEAKLIMSERPKPAAQQPAAPVRGQGGRFVKSNP